MKHYEKTKGMTLRELDRYMIANLSVGDTVDTHSGRCAVIFRTDDGHFLLRRDMETPFVAACSAMDIKEDD